MAGYANDESTGGQAAQIVAMYATNACTTNTQICWTGWSASPQGAPGASTWGYWIDDQCVGASSNCGGLAVASQGGFPAIDTAPGDPSYLGAGSSATSLIGGTAFAGNNFSTDLTSTGLNGTSNITANSGLSIIATGTYGSVPTNGSNVTGLTAYGVRGVVFGGASGGTATEESAFFAQASCDSGGPPATTSCNGLHIQAVTGGAANTGIRIDNLGGTNTAILTGTGLINFGGFLTQAPTTVGALPAAAAGNAGYRIVVSDSSTIITEGQTCAGSGGETAFAFSDGTVWKCF